MHFSDARGGWGKNRWLVWSLAGVIFLLLLVGITGLAVIAEQNDVLVGVEPASAVREAADRLDDESSHARIVVTSPLGLRPITQECEVDPSTRRTRCVLSGLGPEGELILTTDAIYSRRPGLGRENRDGQKPWTRIMIGELPRLPGQALDFMTKLPPSLSESGNTTDVGLETIDGVRVRHYRTEMALAGIELPGGAQPAPVVDVWLDKEGRLRRSVIAASALGVEFRVQIDISYGGIDQIELPRPEDVEDVGPEAFAELFGG